jgi:hypothetical protein
MGFCEHGKNISGSTKVANFLTSRANIDYMDLVPGKVGNVR